MSESTKLLNKALLNIKLIPYKVTWNAFPKKLTCVIVEPRKHENLRGCLYNMANTYANTDVGLIIYHSKENKQFLLDIIKTWENVKLICLAKNNLTKQEYSYLLTRSSFYETIYSSHLLIFQTDSIIFKSIPNFYFNFDYVGAVWPTNYTWGNGCGNGGFSLRRTSTMLNICKNIMNHEEYHPEDIYFSYKNLKIPDFNDRKGFAVELVLHPNPVGCHKYLHSDLFYHIEDQLYEFEQLDSYNVFQKEFNLETQLRKSLQDDIQKNKDKVKLLEKEQTALIQQLKIMKDKENDKFTSLSKQLNEANIQINTLNKTINDNAHTFEKRLKQLMNIKYLLEGNLKKEINERKQLDDTFSKSMSRYKELEEKNKILNQKIKRLKKMRKLEKSKFNIEKGKFNIENNKFDLENNKFNIENNKFDLEKGKFNKVLEELKSFFKKKETKNIRSRFLYYSLIIFILIILVCC